MFGHTAPFPFHPQGQASRPISSFATRIGVRTWKPDPIGPGSPPQRNAVRTDSSTAGTAGAFADPIPPLPVAVVVGVGNPHHRDEGIVAAVVGLLAGRGLDGRWYAATARLLRVASGPPTAVRSRAQPGPVARAGRDFRP
jgi:hypothetical protein